MVGATVSLRGLCLIGAVVTLTVFFVSVNAASDYKLNPAVSQDIMQYVGKECTAGDGSLTDLGALIESKYPGQSQMIVLHLMKTTEYISVDGKGNEVNVMRLDEFKITEITIGELKLTQNNIEHVETYNYGTTLSPGYIAVHGNYYLTGTAEFSSDTSWNPVDTFHIGVLNRDTSAFSYWTRTSSPSYDLSYNPNYPYHYGHACGNPYSNSRNITFSCSYDWNYV